MMMVEAALNIVEHVVITFGVKYLIDILVVVWGNLGVIAVYIFGIFTLSVQPLQSSM